MHVIIRPYTFNEINILYKDTSNEFECSICQDTENDHLKAKVGHEYMCEEENKICTHIFHEKCLNEWRLIENTCPLCRKTMATSSLHLKWNEAVAWKNRVVEVLKHSEISDPLEGAIFTLLGSSMVPISMAIFGRYCPYFVTSLIFTIREYARLSFLRHFALTLGLVTSFAATPYKIGLESTSLFLLQGALIGYAFQKLINNPNFHLLLQRHQNQLR